MRQTLKRILVTCIIFMQLMPKGLVYANGDGNHPPSITNPPSINAFVDDEYSYKPHGEDPDGDSLSWTVVQKPDWLEEVGELQEIGLVGNGLSPKTNEGQYDSADGTLGTESRINVAEESFAALALHKTICKI